MQTESYTTNRKVVGSIPDVISYFTSRNSSSRTVALGSTQPLTEVSARNLPGVKTAVRNERLKTHHHLWADCLENVVTSRTVTLILTDYCIQQIV
jgi:hypothetical protein